MLDLFDSVPLIGQLPLLAQVLALIMASVILCILGAAILERYQDYSRTLEVTGATLGLFGATLGSFTLVFFVMGGLGAIGSAASKSLEREVVPASSVVISPEWDRERITVACDSTPNRGEIELLGRRTSTAFQVIAYRMRAGGQGSDLTRPAWFSLSQRNFYRSGPAPSFSFGPIRADGKWHSRRVKGTVSFSRGDYWLLDASLGVRGKTGAKTLTDVRWLEERCDNVLYSF